MKYKRPSGVELLDKHTMLVSTPQGGRVVLDAKMVSLWEQADGRELHELVGRLRPSAIASDELCAALACLAEAGLLLREGETKQPRVYPSVVGGRVSVVVVNYNSQEWLKECLPSISCQTWPDLQVIVVDNASSDHSIAWLETEYPQVKLVRLRTRHSFSAAVNQGVAAATGDYLFFINPDVRLEPDAIAQLVAVAEDDASCAAVAAKLKFWWAPGFLNGLGNRVGPSSWGTDNGVGCLDLGQFDSWREVPSACFGAALIPRRAWQSVGPVDESFPMYYEDSEWSYRARLLGYTIRAAPQAVVYHAFGGRVPSGEESGLAPRKLRHVTFGRLRFALKIVGRALPRFLRNYLSEDWANLSRALARRNGQSVQACLGAWFDVLRELRPLLRERRVLQQRRVRSDEELFGLLKGMPEMVVWHGLPELTWNLIQTYYLPLLRSGGTRPMPEFERAQRRHLLIVSNDVVDTKMAGPGMRYLEMARVLNAYLDVTLAVPAETTLEIPGVRLVRYWEERPTSLQILVDNADVALVSGYMVDKFPFLQYTRTRLVVDLYDPFVLENLHYYIDDSISVQESLNQQAVDIVNRLIRLGDFFICGSERQRDFWVGLLTANGRVNPHTFVEDSSLRALIDVVGIGFPNRAPRPRPMLRGIHPAFPPQSRIVLWGGGIWNWLDPLSLVHAWPQVLENHPEARLVFLGTRHPNPLVPRHRMAEQAEALAAEIGEKDRTVFFYEWLPYDEREGLLCEADIGVTLHTLQVETRYSIRTRVLDYLWARLPVLVSEGDVTSEWVEQYGVGRVVPVSDVGAVANALREMLDQAKETWCPAFDPLPALFNWSRVVQPLIQYCLQGGYAPDRQVRPEPVVMPDPDGSLPKRIQHAAHLWRTKGFRVMLDRVWRYLQWRTASG